MASTSGFQAQSSWSFDGIPETKPVPTYERPSVKAESPSPSPTPTDSQSNASRPASPQPTSQQTGTPATPDHEQQQRPNQRNYPPRTCRICFDVVHPTVDLPSEHLPGFLQSTPHVRYESPPDEGGRLIRPCSCKGTSKYVHEGCLNQWRLANPNNARNYYECPTCKFKYRLERLKWAEYVQSTSAELTLTFLVFFISIFLLGFVADPIINLYLEPSKSISWIWSSEPLVPQPSRRRPHTAPDLEPDTWFEHFIKGFASLGLLSFLKLFFSAPVHWIRFGRWGDIDVGGLRMGRGANRPGARGRERVNDLTWVVIVIGVAMFIFSVFKAVRAWSRRALTGLGSKVLDVQVDDENEEEEEEPSATAAPDESAEQKTEPVTS